MRKCGSPKPVRPPLRGSLRRQLFAKRSPTPYRPGFRCKWLVAEVQTLVLHEAGFVALRHFSPSLCCHETWKRESLNTPRRSVGSPDVTLCSFSGWRIMGLWPW
ncbi:uncharacterized protein LOC142359601 isoform X4 [Opisthocomus hoazin]|uniref:uncharacterized protein LOC142359601 isoform X4 n=1 Tax=Opisthocomus hoazin TaxID=30419 RepID=UPI003F5323EF